MSFSVDLHVQSVAKYIPNGEENDSQFAGFVSVKGGGRNGPVGTSDPNARYKQIDTQKKDAEERVIVWHAEDPKFNDLDAEGEEDPDFFNDSGIGLEGPLGMRKADGSIVPIIEQPDEAMEMDEADNQIFGRPEPVPSHIRKLVNNTSKVQSVSLTELPKRGEKPHGSHLEPTQQIDETQTVPSSTVSIHNTPVEGTNAQGTLFNGSVISRGVDTQMIKQILEQNSAMEWTADNEMLGKWISHLFIYC